MNTPQDPAHRVEADPGMPVPDATRQEWVAQARHSIRAHPLRCVAGAVVFGLLLARILR